MTEVIQVRVTYIHPRLVYVQTKGIPYGEIVFIDGHLFDGFPDLTLGMVLEAEIQRSDSDKPEVIKVSTPEDLVEPVMKGRIRYFSRRKGSGSLQPEAKTGNLTFTSENLGSDAQDPRVREGVLCTYVLNPEGEVAEVRLALDTPSYRGRLRSGEGPPPVQTTPDRDCRGQGTLGRYYYNRARVIMATTGK